MNRADSIRIWLEDPQIFNRPPKPRYATGEPHYRIGNIGRLCKSRYRIANIGLEAVQSQADLSRLSKEDLQAFVRSRVAVGCSRKNISDLLSLAQEAWTKPKPVRSKTITPEELRPSADLGELSKDDLRKWCQSRGWTRSNRSMKRADLVDLARDDPAIETRVNNLLW